MVEEALEQESWDELKDSFLGDGFTEFERGLLDVFFPPDLCSTE